MAARAQSTEAIEKHLGEPWARTRARLEAAGGAEASHKELADALYPQFEGRVDNHGWWVQGAVVAFEQEIGRRIPGQRADGTFEVAVTRTLPGPREAVIDTAGDLLATSLGAGEGVAGAGLEGPPRTSTTPKRSYWRASLTTGARLEVAAEPKKGTTEEEATALVITVSRLPSPEALEDWRTWAKDLLGRL